MNPLLRKREHQRALIVISLLGAIAGVLFGFIHSSSFMFFGTWQAFAAWLSNPASYWPWPLFGFILTAAAFYGVQLLRSAN